MNSEPSHPRDAIAALVGRNRALVWSGIVGLSGLAWLYLVYLSRGMSAVKMDSGMATMPGMSAVLAAWTVADVPFTMAMWASPVRAAEAALASGP